MKNRMKFMIKGIVIATIVVLFTTVNSYSNEYAALEGVNDIKVVFDVRAKVVKKAAIQLGLVHQMYKDKNIRNVSKKPEFVVVFGGAAVKLLSTKQEEFSDEEKVLVNQIAGILAAMVKDGIRLEICMFAGNIYNIDPATVLPGIHLVDNGWISLAGYQAKGYSLVAAY